MTTGAMISEAQFRAAISPDVVRGMRILQAANAAGLVLFGAAILYIASKRPEVPTPTAAATQQILQFSIAHAAVACITWFVSSVLFGALLQRQRRAASVAAIGSDAPISAGTEGAAALLEAIRKTWILRLALREGAGLFGLAVCYLAVQFGVTDAHPIAALNGASAAAAVASFVIALPTEERLVAVYRRYCTAASLR